MSETKAILYQPLPKSISNEETKVQDLQEELKSFLQGNVPASEQNEISDEFKKIVQLFRKETNKGRKGAKKLRKKGQYLTTFEKKKLGLNKLPKKGLRFVDFHVVNGLWKDYMKELLGEINTSGGSSVDQTLQMKICRADFHGAFIKVTRSNAKSQVGLEGFVVMETRNTIQLITKDNTVKIIPKIGTSISYVIQGNLVTISLTNFCLKPSERAVKKWKNKPPYDL